MKLLSNRTRALGLLVMGAALAATPPPAAAQKANATFKVVCVANRDAADITQRQACVNAPLKVSFGDEVTLAVAHAPEVDFDDATEPNPADLVLFLEGKPLPGTRASVGKSQVDPDGVTTTLLTYRITRDLSSQTGRANWKEVLVAAQNRHVLSVSTGLENGTPALSQATVEFQAFQSDRLVLWFVVAIVGAVLFFLLAVRTGVLRDGEPAGWDVQKPTDRAYSLARVQMALWTVLVLYAYLFVWFLTGEYKGTIPASAVGLMGITLTAFGAASAVDAGKVKEAKVKLGEVKAQRLVQPNDQALLKDEAQLQAQAEVCKSDGFLRDITTSAESASLHRLQFIFWTVALAVVFVVTVCKTLAMPDFDATLLGLMGLTSAAYVGLKLPEAKT